MLDSEPRTNPVLLITELIRVLTLPIVFFVLLYLYHEPLISKLTASESLIVKILGVELSASSSEDLKEFTEKEAKLNAEMLKLKEIMGRLQRERDTLAANNLDLTSQLKSAYDELEKKDVDVTARTQSLAQQREEAEQATQDGEELSKIAKQRVADAQRTLTGSKYDVATARERAGFDGLIEGNFSKALDEFSTAEEVYPDLHNVSEIARLLRQRLRELESADPNTSQAARADVYQQIVERLSWGMPASVTTAMQEFLLLSQPSYVADAMYGSSRKTVSDRIAALKGDKRKRAVATLLEALLPDDDRESYRVNLYIARTLGKMKPSWEPSGDQCEQLDRRTRSTELYRDNTFKERVDEALKPCNGA